MSIRKNNKRNYSKNIIVQTASKAIDYDSYAKEGLSGDYFVFNEIDRQNHILFENRVFLDRDKNGGCHQWHRYLDGKIFHRTATITNGRAVWSNWHEMKNYSYIAILDQRIDTYDRFSNERNNQFQNSINSLQYAQFGIMEPAINNSLRYSIDRANDAWNRTEDQYNWCLDDICLNNFEPTLLGYPGSEILVKTPYGVNPSTVQMPSGTLEGRYAFGIEYIRRVPVVNALQYVGRQKVAIDNTLELNKNMFGIINIGRYTLNAIEHSTRIVTGMDNISSYYYYYDWAFARTLSYKGRRRGWTVAGHG